MLRAILRSLLHARRRQLIAVCCGAPLALGGINCTNNDTTTSLIDWASTSSGGLVQVIVNSLLTAYVNDRNPDPSAPLASQQH